MEINLLFGWLITAAVIFLAYFYRDPNRNIPSAKNAIVAPADGRVVSVLSDKKWHKIAIFMNLHNVHVQRVPFDGTILSIKKVEGKNLPAYKKDAGHNKQVVTTIKTKKGNFVVKQMTGLLVRRISVFVKPNDAVKKGQRLGRIAFGSRVELWLPVRKVKISVKEKDKVLAGETIVAYA